MLKIKSNINEFTIIFLRRFERKNECKRISFSLYQFQRLLYASVPLSLLLLSSLVSSPFFFFSFLPWSARRLPLFLSSAYFSFSSNVLPFFSPSVEPKMFFSSAQHISFFFFSFLFSAHLFYFSSAPPFVAFVQLAFHLSLAPHFFFSIDMLLF